MSNVVPMTPIVVDPAEAAGQQATEAPETWRLRLYVAGESAAVDVGTEWDTAVLDALDDPACDDCETGYLLNDPERLATIDRLGLHGHLGDPHLDAIVATVAAVCDVPLAVVNIVTPDLQTYPAELGVGSCSTAVPDGLSFCAEVVHTRKGLVVADAPSHPVYGANPLVVAGVIGAYASEPLVYGEHVIGTLSVFDSVPREFTTSDLDLLRAQAQLVTAAVRLRALEAWDPLTGLGNRPMLLERAERALLERTDGQAVALLVLDVIGMRDLNATMGTPAGDLLLKEVAGRIRGACGPADSVARIGGDEFAVLLDHDASGDDARARAASICAAVRGHVEVQGVSLVVDIRWGLTTSHAVTADELLVAAERAAFEVLTAPDQTGTQQPPDDVAELAAAIDNGELVLHYHPVVELSTGTVTGVEALVRWQHPTRGLLMPLHFIPLAEASGLIVQLGDWVLRTGAAQAHEWASRGLLLDVAINLSPLQMTAPSFADHCLAVLAAIEAPVERIVLEVTESAFLDQLHAREGLMQVRRSGVRLALDDFGTGYSSFSYLRQFPIDIIKIDRSFVSGLGENADDDAIVASVVGLARNTGKSIIAEGVETTAQLLHLRNLGVDAAQGFFWTRPLPADSLERWIEANQQAGWALPVASPSLPPGSRRPFSPDEVEIFQMHGEGASLHTIAPALNGAGSRTSVGMRWHARSVAQVISPPVPLRRPPSGLPSPATGTEAAHSEYRMNEPNNTVGADGPGSSGQDPPSLPPAVQAARRAPGPRGASRPKRAYPVVAEQDAAVSGPQAAALRALLRATSADQVAPVLATFIHDLGGGLVSARLADPANTLPMDVSLGLSEPLLPYADPVSVAAMRLARDLPEMMEDARLVIRRLQGEVQSADEATRDPLTGLLTRRAWMRRLAEAEAGDSVCLIDLDRFKSVNDREGHSAGDTVLRAIGAVLLLSFRQADSCGRYGGDELTCLTPGLSAQALAQRCEVLRAQWEQQRPECAAAVGLSIGVATVTAEGGRAALQSADEAMYRAKRAGRGRTVIADVSAQDIE